jgi:hypothetical protein
MLGWIREKMATKESAIATLLWKSGRMTLTLPTWGLGSPPGVPKL